MDIKQKYFVSKLTIGKIIKSAVNLSQSNNFE